MGMGALSNSVDLDKMLKNTASDQCLPSLP